MTREETQITWSSAANKSVASAGTEVSDAFTFDAGTWDAAVQLSADNAGTPASGDTVEFRILYTTGDILGDNSGDDYDTVEHGVLLAVLDTYATNTPGENPARVTIPLPTVAAKGLKIQALNKSSGRAIVVSARISEMTGSVS